MERLQSTLVRYWRRRIGACRRLITPRTLCLTNLMLFSESALHRSCKFRVADSELGPHLITKRFIVLVELTCRCTDVLRGSRRLPFPHRLVVIATRFINHIAKHTTFLWPFINTPSNTFIKLIRPHTVKHLCSHAPFQHSDKLYFYLRRQAESHFNDPLPL